MARPTERDRGVEKSHKHLDFIQATITRMAGNSFLLKGWTVTLVSALLALGAKDADRRFVTVALLPTMIFWTLDGYFLFQERLYRSLYDHVRSLSPERIDY